MRRLVAVLLCVVLTGCGAAAPALADAVEPEDTTQAETETAEGEEAQEQEPRAANADDVMRIEDALGAVRGRLDSLEDGQQSALSALSGVAGSQADMVATLAAVQAESGTNPEILAAIGEVRDIMCIGCATLAALLGSVALLPLWLQVAGGPNG